MQYFFSESSKFLFTFQNAYLKYLCNLRKIRIFKQNSFFKIIVYFIAYNFFINKDTFADYIPYCLPFRLKKID